MNTDSFSTEIFKHLNKVKRIITELSEDHPPLAEKLDTALYAILKV